MSEERRVDRLLKRSTQTYLASSLVYIILWVRLLYGVSSYMIPGFLAAILVYGIGLDIFYRALREKETFTDKLMEQNKRANVFALTAMIWLVLLLIREYSKLLS